MVVTYSKPLRKCHKSQNGGCLGSVGPAHSRRVSYCSFDWVIYFCGWAEVQNVQLPLDSDVTTLIAVQNRVALFEHMAVFKLQIIHRLLLTFVLVSICSNWQFQLAVPQHDVCWTQAFTAFAVCLVYCSFSECQISYTKFISVYSCIKYSSGFQPLAARGTLELEYRTQIYQSTSSSDKKRKCNVL